MHDELPTAIVGGKELSMTKHLPAEQLAGLAQIHDQIPQGSVVDRSFELPVALYGLTIACYLAFLAIMAAVFTTAELAIPMAIFVVYIAMAFGVPAMWTAIGPDNGARRLSWEAFRRSGVETHYGRVTAGSAIAQVLIMPAAVLGWGIAVAVIASMV
jgi:hypothetical protein